MFTPTVTGRWSLAEHEIAICRDFNKSIVSNIYICISDAVGLLIRSVNNLGISLVLLVLSTDIDINHICSFTLLCSPLLETGERNTGNVGLSSSLEPTDQPIWPIIDLYLLLISSIFNFYLHRLSYKRVASWLWTWIMSEYILIGGLSRLPLISALYNEIYCQQIWFDYWMALCVDVRD